MNHCIAPSMLASDFANLQREVEMLNESRADYIHLDIMDGNFVPNISFGLPVVEAIKKHAKKPLDVHLMISHPAQYIEPFYNAGADILNVHYEVSPHLHRSVQKIKSLGMQAGVTINPHTPVQVLSEILANIDLVLIMSVNPGFGGQKFIPNTLRKIESLGELKKITASHAMIEVDGGIDEHNAPQLIEAGAEILVMGSFIFKSKNPPETIQRMKNISSEQTTDL